MFGPDLLRKRRPSPLVAAFEHLKEERNRLRVENIQLKNKVLELEGLLRQHRGQRRNTW